MVVRPKRPAPKLDMNPMVDLAFLLVTFFMLTTTFKTEEPAIVDIPSSHSEIKLPDTDLLVISVDSEGRCFLSIQGQNTRKRVLQLMADRYNVAVSDDQLESFGLVAGFGIPLKEIPSWLSLRPDERTEKAQPGIPADSTSNELRDWAVFSRIANPRIRIAIKGDRETPYPAIHKLTDMLVENNINRFNLITDLEKELVAN